MNLYKIKANSEGVVQSYGCLVEFILLLYPAILGVLQIIHLVYRYLLYVKDYQSTPYWNHIGDGDFLLIYASGGVACVAALLLIVCAYFERRHPEFESKLSEISCSRSFITYVITAVVLLLINIVPMTALWWMREQKILVSYGEFIIHRSAEKSAPSNGGVK